MTCCSIQLKYWAQLFVRTQPSPEVFGITLQTKCLASVTAYVKICDFCVWQRLETNYRNCKLSIEFTLSWNYMENGQQFVRSLQSVCHLTILRKRKITYSKGLAYLVLPRRSYKDLLGFAKQENYCFSYVNLWPLHPSAAVFIPSLFVNQTWI